MKRKSNISNCKGSLFTNSELTTVAARQPDKEGVPRMAPEATMKETVEILKME